MSWEAQGISILTKNVCVRCHDDSETVQKAFLDGKWFITHEKIDGVTTRIDAEIAPNFLIFNCGHVAHKRCFSTPKNECPKCYIKIDLNTVQTQINPPQYKAWKYTVCVTTIFLAIFFLSKLDPLNKGFV